MRFLFFLPLGLGCAEMTASDLIEGEFEFRSIHGEDNGVNVPAGLSLTISGTTVTISTDDGELASGEVSEQPEEEWLQDCITNASSTLLKTYHLNTTLSIDIIDYATPVIVPSCSGEEVNISEAGVFSEDHIGCAEETCLYFVLK